MTAQETRLLRRIEQLLSAVLERLDSGKREIHHELKQLKEIAMSDQDTINAEAAKVDDLAAAFTILATTVKDMADEITALKNQPGAAQLDFSALDQKLNDALTSVRTLNAQNPDPGPQGG